MIEKHVVSEESLKTYSQTNSEDHLAKASHKKRPRDESSSSSKGKGWHKRLRVFGSKTNKPTLTSEQELQHFENIMGDIFKAFQNFIEKVQKAYPEHWDVMLRFLECLLMSQIDNIALQGWKGAMKDARLLFSYAPEITQLFARVLVAHQHLEFLHFLTTLNRLRDQPPFTSLSANNSLPWLIRMDEVKAGLGYEVARDFMRFTSKRHDRPFKYEDWQEFEPFLKKLPTRLYSDALTIWNPPISSLPSSVSKYLIKAKVLVTQLFSPETLHKHLHKLLGDVEEAEGGDVQGKMQSHGGGIKTKEAGLPNHMRGVFSPTSTQTPSVPSAPSISQYSNTLDTDDTLMQAPMDLEGVTNGEMTEKEEEQKGSDGADAQQNITQSNSNKSIEAENNADAKQSKQDQPATFIQPEEDLQSFLRDATSVSPSAIPRPLPFQTMLKGLGAPLESLVKYVKELEDPSHMQPLLQTALRESNFNAQKIRLGCWENLISRPFSSYPAPYSSSLPSLPSQPPVAPYSNPHQRTMRHLSPTDQTAQLYPLLCRRFILAFDAIPLSYFNNQQNEKGSLSQALADLVSANDCQPSLLAAVGKKYGVSEDALSKWVNVMKAYMKKDMKQLRKFNGSEALVPQYTFSSELLQQLLFSTPAEEGILFIPRSAPNPTARPVSPSGVDNKTMRPSIAGLSAQLQAPVLPPPSHSASGGEGGASEAGGSSTGEAGQGKIFTLTFYDVVNQSEVRLDLIHAARQKKLEKYLKRYCNYKQIDINEQRFFTNGEIIRDTSKTIDELGLRDGDKIMVFRSVASKRRV